ncbi:MAG: hypothetical protein V4582_07990 [Pseudomonadota bacterium]
MGIRNRWQGWALAGSATLLLLALAWYGWAQTVASRSCALGPPPDAPEFAQAQAREAAEVRANGFLRVCDANLERFDLSWRSTAGAVRNLASAPVELSGTPFAQFHSVGARAEAVSDINSRLYRGFRMPEGHTVTLFEHDMSADGSRATRAASDEPERINGRPARLVVLQADSGRAVSQLSWFEGRRYYELWIDANVAHHPLRASLFALAGALPAATPACPNEAAQPPMHIGPDGLPVEPAMPEVLTQEQMKAFLDAKDGARPCRTASL